MPEITGIGQPFSVTFALAPASLVEERLCGAPQVALYHQHVCWPRFLIVDGAPGLENAIAAVWDEVPVQRCTVHKHRNLLAHAPERLHEEISTDYNDMIIMA